MILNWVISKPFCDVVTVNFCLDSLLSSSIGIFGRYFQLYDQYYAFGFMSYLDLKEFRFDSRSCDGHLRCDHILENDREMMCQDALPKRVVLVLVKMDGAPELSVVSGSNHSDASSTWILSPLRNEGEPLVTPGLSASRRMGISALSFVSWPEGNK